MTVIVCVVVVIKPLVTMEAKTPWAIRDSVVEMLQVVLDPVIPRCEAVSTKSVAIPELACFLETSLEIDLGLVTETLLVVFRDGFVAVVKMLEDLVLPRTDDKLLAQTPAELTTPELLRLPYLLMALP